MAQRYCTNCGTKLGDEVRFCPSCGRPVHETAAVSTPEADVSVPSAPGAEERQKPRISLGQFLVGFFVLIAAIWLLIPTGNGSGGGGGSANPGDGNQAVAPEKAKQDDRAGESKAAPDSKPEPKPKPKPEPAPRPISLSGNASQAKDFFEMEEGLAVFNFSHRGK